MIFIDICKTYTLVNNVNYFNGCETLQDEIQYTLLLDNTCSIPTGNFCDDSVVFILKS
jgi:hypothetical protein